MFRASLYPSPGEQTIKPRVVLAWLCWLRLCGVGTRVERTVRYTCGICWFFLLLR